MTEESMAASDQNLPLKFVRADPDCGHPRDDYVCRMLPSKPFIVEAGPIVIGAVVFTGWDAGMAVAFGIFRPNEVYTPSDHATVLDGCELQNAGEIRVSWADGKPLTCEAIGLLDYAANAGDDGREITAFGVRDIAFSADI